MKLVIVESPTKAKTLGKFLPKEYEVEATMGHLRDLPKSKIGVEVDNNFEPTYEVVKGKAKVVKKLKDMAQKASKIYLAMDPDREGEAIAWHVKHLLSEGKGKKKLDTKIFERVSFHEITKTAIEKALKEPGKVHEELVDAQQARRVVDRLVGYNLSPVLWKKVRRGLSAGRVQSVALRLIVEREDEIKAFKAQAYFDIAVTLKNGETFIARLTEIKDKKLVTKGSDDDKGKNVTYITTKKEAEPVTQDLKKAAYVVEKVEKKERQRRPYPPYTTSTLQQAAANVLGWSGKQTMRIAQQLYEAGFITYHRTDSVNLAQEAITLVREDIKNRYGAQYLPEKPQFYQTKSKNAQEAHEAIRPTTINQETLPETNGLTAQHEKLYQLVWRRMMACQMKPALYDQTAATIKAKGKNEYQLKANGSIVLFDGWRKAYGKSGAGKTEEDMILPELKPKMPLTYVSLTSEQKATQPPPRFNDASLVKELEKRGIGRPSTYAPIISTLIERGYMERTEKRFIPSSVGLTVVNFLKEHFKTIMDYDFTAEMEEDLDRIARAEKKWKAVMKTFYSPFEKTVTDAEKVKRVEIPVEKTGEICPECKEGELVIRSGRFGKFMSCGRFPECKYTATYRETLEDFACPECKGEVVLKRTRKGRTFYGCSNYPKCTWASWQDPRQDKKGKTA